jgi:hypothetical protein
MELPIKALVLGCPEEQSVFDYEMAVHDVLCGLGLDYDQIDVDGNTIIIRNIRLPEPKENEDV